MTTPEPGPDRTAARLATDLVVVTRRFTATLPAFARAMVNNQALDQLTRGLAEALTDVIRRAVAETATPPDDPEHIITTWAGSPTPVATHRPGADPERAEP